MAAIFVVDFDYDFENISPNLNDLGLEMNSDWNDSKNLRYQGL